MSYPYVSTAFEQWLNIRTGQSQESDGAHRWEAVNTNGWAVFNNGRDLPCTYRVGDLEALPIYELREQGIAWVETIAENSGILLAGDVAEIPDEHLDDWFQFVGVTNSNAITATQSGVTVTATGDIFTSNMVGMWIKYANGQKVKITAYTSARVVSATAYTNANGQTFQLWPEAGQTGATYSSTTNGSMASGSATVTATTAIFTAAMVGRYVWFINGWHRKISTLIGASPSTQCTLEEAPTFDIAAQPFFIVDATTAYTVTASSPLFTADMVGLEIMWEDGTTREITTFTDTQHVEVDDFVTHATGIVGVENINIYEAYSYPERVNRIAYKFLCSMIGEPRRWASIGSGTIQAGSRLLKLDYPMKSLEVGHQILIVGAGVAGGNHTTTIERVFGLNTHFYVTTAANTGVTGANVIRADAVASIVGGYEIKDDSSRIIRMLTCRNDLVIYKDTGIFLAHYTGDLTDPWNVKKLTIPEGRTLHYPWSLVSVEGMWHFYAGKRGIYRFDLVDQIPVPLDTAEMCKDLFFDYAQSNIDNDVWAAMNTMTQEIWFSFPTEGADKLIAFDYRHNVASTIGREYTAAGMIKRPFTDQSEDMFLLGHESGAVLTYGYLDVPNALWGGRRKIYFTRNANPYSATLYDYESILASGTADLGDPSSEKEWTGWCVHPASQEIYMEAVTIDVDFKGCRNVSEAPVLQGTLNIPYPKEEPDVPIYYSHYCLQDVIRVSGYAPFNLSRRVWEVTGVNTKNIARQQSSE